MSFRTKGLKDGSRWNVISTAQGKILALGELNLKICFLLLSVIILDLITLTIGVMMEINVAVLSAAT